MTFQAESPHGAIRHLKITGGMGIYQRESVVLNSTASDLADISCRSLYSPVPTARKEPLERMFRDLGDGGVKQHLFVSSRQHRIS